MLSLRTPLLIVSAAAAFALAGCTSSTYTCDGSSCKLSLSGKDSSTTIGDGGDTVTLVKADGKTAWFTVGDGKFKLSKGQKVVGSDGTLTVTEVGDNSMKLTVTEGETASEESDAAAEEDTTTEDPAAEEEVTEDPAAEEEVTEEPAE